MPLLRELWKLAEPVYRELVEHPFYSGLREGTLPEAVFGRFLQQDALYLREDAAAFHLLALRISLPADAAFLRKLATTGIAAEEEMQERYFRKYHLQSARQMGPVLQEYTAFLRQQAAEAQVPEALASLLPCYWLFREVGLYALEHARSGNPYQDWLDTYADENYAADTENLKQMVVRQTENCEPEVIAQMKEGFLISCQYEKQFVDEIMQD